MDAVTVGVLRADDLDAVLAFWRRIEGLGLSDVGAPEPLARYLARNPGVSAAARGADGQLAGVALCGHDGRLGYLHHVAVDPRRRGQGLASRLVAFSLDALAREGIAKCHLFVFRENEAGLALFSRLGWERRDELLVLSAPVRCPG